ncbi:MAG: VOC family protein [Steroidobacteraceae bacterium]|jgi:predicted enzyme related to lactoylglutathione lyase
MTSSFIWYELLTSDPAAAARFYGEVLGWTAGDSGHPGMDYRIFSMQGVGVGGLMAFPPGAVESGMRPMWLGYVSVADVDASVARFLAAGGALHMPARDLPNVGRIAMIADPQGALLYVMTALGSGPATSFAPRKPGHGGWHELHTKDWAAALAFYRDQFGWNQVHAMDMGHMGTYLQFNFGSGPMVGGMMNDADADRPFWLYVFNVDDIDTAHGRVISNGGEVPLGPLPVPTGEWVLHARDPQGARFALVGGKH